jgi:hypothetical protein
MEATPINVNGINDLVHSIRRAIKKSRDQRAFTYQFENVQAILSNLSAFVASS